MYVTWINTSQQLIQFKAVRLPNLKSLHCFCSVKQELQPCTLEKASVCCLAYSSQSAVFIMNGLLGDRCSWYSSQKIILHFLVAIWDSSSIIIDGHSYRAVLNLLSFPLSPFSFISLNSYGNDGGGFFIFKWLWLANKLCRIHKGTCLFIKGHVSV